MKPTYLIQGHGAAAAAKAQGAATSLPYSRVSYGRGSQGGTGVLSFPLKDAEEVIIVGSPRVLNSLKYLVFTLTFYRNYF